MDKIKFIPLVLFCAAAIKGLINGVSWESATVLLILSCLAAFYEQRREDAKLKKINEDLESLKEQIKEKNKEVDEIKTHLAAYKLNVSKIRA